MEKKWYVLQVFSVHVKNIILNLQAKYKDIVYSPILSYRVCNIKTGKFVNMQAPMFLNYCFIQTSDLEYFKFEIDNEFKGTVKFLEMDSAILPIDDEYIEIYKQKEESCKQLMEETHVRYKIGTHVCILHGPFVGFTGKIQGSYGNRVKVYVDVFNRSTIIDVDIDSVRKADT